MDIYNQRICSAEAYMEEQLECRKNNSSMPLNKQRLKANYDSCMEAYGELIKEFKRGANKDALEELRKRIVKIVNKYNEIENFEIAAEKGKTVAVHIMQKQDRGKAAKTAPHSVAFTREVRTDSKTSDVRLQRRGMRDIIVQEISKGFFGVFEAEQFVNAALEKIKMDQPSLSIEEFRILIKEEVDKMYKEDEFAADGKFTEEDIINLMQGDPEMNRDQYEQASLEECINAYRKGKAAGSPEDWKKCLIKRYPLGSINGLKNLKVRIDQVLDKVFAKPEAINAWKLEMVRTREWENSACNGCIAILEELLGTGSVTKWDAFHIIAESFPSDASRPGIDAILRFIDRNLDANITNDVYINSLQRLKWILSTRPELQAGELTQKIDGRLAEIKAVIARFQEAWDEL